MKRKTKRETRKCRIHHIHCLVPPILQDWRGWVTSAGEHIASECPTAPVWTHWTMVSSDCDGTMAGSHCNRAGWELASRGEASLFIYLFHLYVKRHPQTSWPGPVNEQDLIVQSSNWFGISSVYFSSLGTNLSRKFVQFSSGHLGKVSPISSVHSVRFTNSSGPDCIIWLDTGGWVVAALFSF